MTTLSPTDVHSAFRTVQRVYLAVFGISVAALVAAFALRSHPDLVNGVVWIRGAAVAVGALILVPVARAAARGSRTAFVRLRWVSTVVPIGAVLIVAVPDNGYPLWMKGEQGLVGAIVLIAAVIVNRRGITSRFPKKQRPGKPAK